MSLNIQSIFRIIGAVLLVIGLCMLPSVFVSMRCDEPSVYMPFIWTMVSALLIGAILTKACKSHMKQLKVRDGFLIVTLCWLIAGVLGAIPFVATGSIPNLADAFFESCSGFSTTGSSILSDVESLPKGIVFWRSFTHWIGGMGILIFAIALMPSLGISGQNIAVSETPGPSLDKVSPKMSDTAKILYVIYFLFTVLETILLMLGGLNLYDALVQTFGTVGTGGFSNYNDGISHFNSTYVTVVITAFMVLCGINFNLFYFSVKRGIRVFWQDSEFKLYLLVFGTSSIFMTMVLLLGKTYSSFPAALTDSAFQSASILTTTGFASPDYETWPTICQIVLLMLMFMGGCSSSTSGGIKIVRIYVLLQLIRRGIATRLHPNVIENITLNDKKMPSETVSAIASHMFLYFVLVFAGAFVISFENLDLLTCFSSAITCLGNIGPGFGIIGPTENFASLSDFSKVFLSIYMIAGRLELFTLFILLTPRFWNANH